MNNLFQMYKKVDGHQILKQYAMSHMLIRTLLLVPQVGCDKKALEIVRLFTDYKLQKQLRRRYRKFIKNWKHSKQFEGISKINQRTSGYIWFCWLQGLDKAPDIVRVCYESIVKNNPGRKVVVITSNNYSQYVQFPAFIETMFRDGIISRTHFSDLLRLELLVRYGGTWMDSTVFCSDTPYDYMTDADLFLFQDLKPGLNGHSITVSNWFITSRPGNNILTLTRDLLYEYWQNHDKVENYYIFHHMFQIATEVFPDEWKKIFPFSNSLPHMLLLRLFDQYDERTWKIIMAQTPVHKLTYKFEEGQLELDGTYYRQIITLH